MDLWYKYRLLRQIRLSQSTLYYDGTVFPKTPAPVTSGYSRIVADTHASEWSVPCGHLVMGGNKGTRNFLSANGNCQKPMINEMSETDIVRSFFSTAVCYFFCVLKKKKNPCLRLNELDTHIIMVPLNIVTVNLYEKKNEQKFCNTQSQTCNKTTMPHVLIKLQWMIERKE